MSRIALLQELRRMKFSEYYARTKARKLTQIEAASLLGMSERSFRRYGKRFAADGADGLFDRRLAKVPQNRVGVDTVMKMLALFDRAEARDFADVFALAKHFSKELLLLRVQLCLVDFLDRTDFLGDPVPAIVHIGELTAANPTDLLVNLCR